MRQCAPRSMYLLELNRLEVEAILQPFPRSLSLDDGELLNHTIVFFYLHSYTRMHTCTSEPSPAAASTTSPQ